MRAIVVSMLAMGTLCALPAPAGERKPAQHPILERCALEECILVPASEFKRMIDLQVEQRLRADSDPAECWRMRT